MLLSFEYVSQRGTTQQWKLASLALEWSEEDFEYVSRCELLSSGDWLLWCLNQYGDNRLALGCALLYRNKNSSLLVEE